MLVGRSTGGIGTHAVDLTAGLRALGDEVEFVTDAVTADRFEVAGARLWWPGRAAGVGGSVRGLAGIRRLARTADVVHAHGHQAGLVAVLATLGLRVPVVVSQHNAVLDSGSGGVRGAVSRAAQRLVARRARLVTGASSDLVATARDFGARHTELAEVPSPRVPILLAAPIADTATRSQAARDLLHTSGIRDTGPLVVTISRIAPQKSLDVLVRAAAALERPVTWVVIGAGEPELQATLEGAAERLGAPVHFVGHVPDPSQWLAVADLFVLPSQWEARALVVQEAMAAGVPVVATDTGGLHDLVGEAGLLVPVGDADAVARAVEQVLDSPALRESLSRQGRQVATSWDDSEATARRWRQWYTALPEMT
jgi:glycosyltransferase involved in cell wall biosynthesis